MQIPINAPILAVLAPTLQEAKKLVQQKADFVAPKQDGWFGMGVNEISFGLIDAIENAQYQLFTTIWEFLNTNENKVRRGPFRIVLSADIWL